MWNYIGHWCCRELESKNPTAAEIKAEVEMHLQNKEIIEAILPTSIMIGPFYINTEGVRQGLSKKRKSLAGAVLELLAKKLRMQAEEVTFSLWYHKLEFEIWNL